MSATLRAPLCKGAGMHRSLALAFLLLLLSGASAARAAGGLTVTGSVQQIDVTGAAPGARLALHSSTGATLATRRATSLGAVVFRGLRTGPGYRVTPGGGGAVTVLPDRPAPPSTKGYDQRIPKSGYGYLRTRDGTKLAIDVRLPSGKGPFPTLVEYSGYGYARPSGAQSGISPIATLLGFAVVDVNMRGTGCSGGAFDYFDPLQSLDGYDAVETVARQPWVLHHKVGMMGISYGGISQLFVGATNPPSLAAIAPLSVIDNTATTLYPGGFLNTGFALNWGRERVHDAMPASATGGQPWALERIKDGDRTCQANQALHSQAVDLIAKIRRNKYYVPSVADPLSPVTFVHKIHEPVFLACQWEDEQTGGHCATLASRLTGTKRKWITFTNGTHIDSLDPATFNRWLDFLSLYVARRVPRVPGAIAKALAPTIFAVAMGVKGVQLPPDPIQEKPTYASALAAFQKLPPVRILFDNGGVEKGKPYPAFEQSWPRFPLPRTRARSWWLAGGGLLSDYYPRTHGGADAFTWRQSARPPTDFTGDTSGGTNGLWTDTPSYRWTENSAGTAVSYVTRPLRGPVAVIGAGALRAWVKTSVPSADLQVTVSEVRPDGREVFVQNGWLRTSARKLDPAKSTFLEPVPSLTRADAAPMPRGRFARVVVPLYYEGHVYRRGSRLRIVVTAPSGDQPVWSFGETTPTRSARITIARSAPHASRLVLPVVGHVRVPHAERFPPCPGLRGEPCRRYVPIVNGKG